MRLFSQSLKGEVKKWFRALAPRSIQNFRRFEVVFLEKWEEKKNLVQMLTSYNQLRRGNDESIKNNNSRFNTIYNSLLEDCKPLEGMEKLHYAKAFDDDFALFLRERRSATLVDMMSDAIEGDIRWKP